LIRGVLNLKGTKSTGYEGIFEGFKKELRRRKKC